MSYPYPPTALESIVHLLEMDEDLAHVSSVDANGPLMKRIQDKLIDHMMNAVGFARTSDLLGLMGGEEWVAEHPEEWARYQEQREWTDSLWG